MVETRITIVWGFDLLYLTMWMRTGSLAVFGVHYLLRAAVHEWMDQGSEIFQVQSATFME